LQRLLVFVFALSVIPGICQVPRPAVKNAVEDTYRPLPFDQQKLTGLLANRLRANVEGHLESIDQRALLAPFINPASNPGVQANETRAAADDLGQFLESAADAYAYTHDFQLEQVMDRVAEDFLSADANLPSGVAAKMDVRTASESVLGLLSYYRVRGAAGAFTESQKIGDALLSAAANPSGFEAASPVQALAALYRYDGDKRALNVSRRIADSWRLNAQPALAEAARRHGRDVLSNLIGLTELYRVTGDSAYLRPVVGRWKSIRDNDLLLTGTLRSSAAAESAENPVDDCVTSAWMQLTLELLRITGEPQYASELERTIYNQLFAAQNAANGDIAPAVALEGRKNFSHALEPCVAAEARALSLLPQTVWGRYGKGIAVMQYTGGRATFRLHRRGTIQVYSEATYPQTGTILLHVDPTHPTQFPLRLRVPDWATGLTADVGDFHVLGKPGEFLTIGREWHRGDTVKIAIGMTVRAGEDGAAHAHEVAVQRGPQVLVFSQMLNPAWKSAAAPAIPEAALTRLKLETADARLPSTWAGDQAYTISGTQFVLVPFADAFTYSVWLKTAPLAYRGANYPAARSLARVQ
jgi:DUF1680 family protein